MELCARRWRPAAVTALARLIPGAIRSRTIGLDDAVRAIKDNGMRVTGYCRGGMFPAADAAGRQAAIDDNRRAIDEAAALGAECLVIVCRRTAARLARHWSARGRWWRTAWPPSCPMRESCNMPLAIEPLHPMTAADRCVRQHARARRSTSATARRGRRRHHRHLSRLVGSGSRISDLPCRRRRPDPRAPHLRLAGANAQPRHRPRHDGRRRHRPARLSPHDRGSRLSSGRRKWRSSPRSTGGNGRATKYCTPASTVTGRTASPSCEVSGGCPFGPEP